MSGFLTEILEQQRDAEPGADIFRGTIAKAVSDVTARLSVYVPAASDTQVWEGCRWQPRVHMVSVNDGGVSASDLNVAQVVYPQKGDACLVAFDENNEVWVLTYWPAAYA